MTRSVSTIAPKAGHERPSNKATYAAINFLYFFCSRFSFPFFYKCSSSQTSHVYVFSKMTGLNIRAMFLLILPLSVVIANPYPPQYDATDIAYPKAFSNKVDEFTTPSNQEDLINIALDVPKYNQIADLAYPPIPILTAPGSSGALNVQGLACYAQSNGRRNVPVCCADGKIRESKADRFHCVY